MFFSSFEKYFRKVIFYFNVSFAVTGQWRGQDYFIYILFAIYFKRVIHKHYFRFIFFNSALFARSSSIMSWACRSFWWIINLTKMSFPSDFVRSFYVICFVLGECTSAFTCYLHSKASKCDWWLYIFMEFFSHGSPRKKWIFFRIYISTYLSRFVIFEFQ